MNSGLYAIVNHRTGDFYVGSSGQIATRRKSHWGMLRRGKHDNVRLQRAFIRDGAESFGFVVLALMPKDDALACEDRLLKRLVGRPDCYNFGIQATSGMAGRKQSPEAIARWHESRSAGAGWARSPETIAKHRAQMTGRKMSPEAVARSAAARRGLPVSPERRARLAEAARAAAARPEVRQRMAAAQRGKRHSAETRKRMSEAHKARYAVMPSPLKGRTCDPDVVRRRAASNVGKKRSEAGRANIAAAVRISGAKRKGQPWTPEYRAKHEATRAANLAAKGAS